MIVRDFKKSDINDILTLGNFLHNNYNFILDDYNKCIVIEDNKKLVGFLTYFIMYEKSEIIDIIINPEYRKKGYSYLLMDFVIDKIKKENCENITLEVNVNNDVAINLYKKYDFKIATVRKKYYGNQDAYLMIKELR